jgi:hypothetical protein
LIDEEIQWQRRGGEKWILAGDSNSSFFHKCANGRRRKMKITLLEVNGQEITDPQCLKAHITYYYKQLFGSAEVADMHLDLDLWPASHQIQQADNEFLTRPFTLEELDATIKEIKNNTAPGPDGFSVEFFKAFWPWIKGDIKEMLDCLHTGHLELWRLNYGVIILLPKVKPATSIKQFRLICLLNVIYKIITKTLTLRITSVIDKVISPFQTAFIPGRNILEGVVILQEVMHEVRTSKSSGVFIKLDFEKAYDKVNWSFFGRSIAQKRFCKYLDSVDKQSCERWQGMC